MIKIIHFISGLANGGVEQKLFNYSQYLNQKAHRFELHIAYQHTANQLILNKMQQLGIICHQLPSKRKAPITYLKLSYQLIKQIDPAIVETHQDSMNILPLLAAKLARTPLRISHVHTNYCPLKPLFLEKLVKKLSYHWATDHFATSQSSGEFYYGQRDFNNVPTAIDFTHFSYSPLLRKQMRQQLKITETTLLCGSVARLEPVKNHLRLLDIFKTFQTKHPDSKLLLIGEGSQYSSINKKINELNLNTDVLLINSVADCRNFYNAMDILIVPSFSEGGPLVAVEAQGTNLPVIMSNGVDPNTRLLDNCELVDLKQSNYYWVKVMEKLLKSNLSLDRTQPQNWDKLGYYKLDQAAIKVARYYQVALKREEHYANNRHRYNHI